VRSSSKEESGLRSCWVACNEAEDSLLVASWKGAGIPCGGIPCRRSLPGMPACFANAASVAPTPPPCALFPADVSVKFRITLSEAKMREALAAGLLDKFKLKSKISTGEGVAGWLWEKKGERCR